MSSSSFGKHGGSADEPRLHLTESMAVTPTEALRLIDPRLDDVVGLPVVRDLLRHAVGESVEHRALTGEQINILLEHRVTPLIPPTWDTPDGLRQLALGLTGLRLRLAATLTEVEDLFADAGLESVVLKGLATSHYDYSPSGLRHSGDIDILVHKRDLDAVSTVLANAGLTPDETSERRYNKGVMYRHPSGIEVDVHTWLTLYVEQSDDVLFANATPADERPRALNPTGRLVHAASHLLYSKPGMAHDPAGERRLTSAADIVAIQHANDIDEAELLALATELNVAAIVGSALRSTRLITGLGLEPGPEWPQPTLLERRSLLRETRSPVLDNLLAASGRDGVADKVGYLWQQLVPSRAVINEIGGYRNYFAKALRH